MALISGNHHIHAHVMSPPNHDKSPGSHYDGLRGRLRLRLRLRGLDKAGIGRTPQRRTRAPRARLVASMTLLYWEVLPMWCCRNSNATSASVPPSAGGRESFEQHIDDQPPPSELRFDVPPQPRCAWAQVVQGAKEIPRHCWSELHLLDGIVCIPSLLELHESHSLAVWNLQICMGTSGAERRIQPHKSLATSMRMILPNSPKEACLSLHLPSSAHHAHLRHCVLHLHTLDAGEYHDW